MKISVKGIFFWSAMVICALFLALVIWVFYFNSQLVVYHDDQYNFSLQYPKTWDVQVHPKPGVAVIFLRPKDTALDTVQESFNVTVQPIPDGLYGLDEFSNRVKAQMVAVFGTSTKFLQYKPIHWGQYKGYKMTIEAEKPDHLVMSNAWALRGNQAYIMTFLGDIRKYNKDILTVDQMIRSLKLQ